MRTSAPELSAWTAFQFATFGWATVFVATTINSAPRRTNGSVAMAAQAYHPLRRNAKLFGMYDYPCAREECRSA